MEPRSGAVRHWPGKRTAPESNNHAFWNIALNEYQAMNHRLSRPVWQIKITTYTYYFPGGAAPDSAAPCFRRMSPRRPARHRTIRSQSQRDCITQPRVARNELPWVKQPNRILNSERVESIPHISFVKFHPISSQKFTKFILKRLVVMVYLLSRNRKNL